MRPTRFVIFRLRPTLIWWTGRGSDECGCGDVAVCHQDGKTPLHRASSRGHLPVVELLLAFGAAPNAAEEVCRSSKSCAHLFVDTCGVDLMDGVVWTLW
jgi:hypothetical protein